MTTCAGARARWTSSRWPPEGWGPWSLSHTPRVGGPTSTLVLTMMRPKYYFCRAMDIARRAGDRYQVAHTLRRAGMLPLERGRLDDSLKLFQLGQITFMPPHRTTRPIP